MTTITEDTIVSRNIALIFECSPEAEQTFIEWSEKINAEIGSHITLNRESMLVHISLYNVRFPERNMAEVEERLGNLASTLKPFDLEFNAKSNVGEYIFVDAVISDYLREIHHLLIEKLNELREGEIYPGALDATGLTDRQRLNIHETGMRLSREDFQPHVTVAVVKQIEDMQLALEILSVFNTIKVRISSLSLVETGPWGTCKNVLKKFTLTEGK